jgi:hypothetical protein
MHEVAPKFKWRGLSPKGIFVPFRRKMPGLHAVALLLVRRMLMLNGVIGLGMASKAELI